MKTNKTIKKAINPEDIPVIEFNHSIGINPDNNSEMKEFLKKKSLKVTAYNLPAYITVIRRSFSSEKVIITFDSPWPNMLATKYFYFEENGIMKWGHHGGEIKITYR